MDKGTEGAGESGGAEWEGRAERDKDIKSEGDNESDDDIETEGDTESDDDTESGEERISADESDTGFDTGDERDGWREANTFSAVDKKVGFTTEDPAP